MSKICTFCGHSELLASAEIEQKLNSEIERLIVTEGVSEFWTGGMGGFDRLAAAVVSGMKKRHSHVRLCLIKAYLNSREDEFDKLLYDETIYPPIEHVHPKGAIIARNRWMVERSDYMIAYIDHSWGGAYKSYAYAKRRGLSIINLCDGFEG